MAFLRYIKPQVWHISGISHTFLRHILGISQRYKVVRALAMLAGEPGLIPGHATNFSNFSDGIGKPL